MGLYIPCVDSERRMHTFVIYSCQLLMEAISLFALEAKNQTPQIIFAI
jgi:hypothetical protein